MSWPAARPGWWVLESSLLGGQALEHACGLGPALGHHSRPWVWSSLQGFGLSSLSLSCRHHQGRDVSFQKHSGTLFLHLPVWLPPPPPSCLLQRLSPGDFLHTPAKEVLLACCLTACVCACVSLACPLPSTCTNSSRREDAILLVNLSLPRAGLGGGVGP